MLRPTDQERIRELERMVASLGDRLSDLEGQRWQRITVAAGILHCHFNTLNYRITNYPDLYPEGIVWRWNPARSIRLINIAEWRKADEGYYQSQKNRRQTAIALMQESRRKERQRQKNSAQDWKKMSIAAEIFGVHPSTFTYRLNTFPHIYKEGKAWKWNRTKTLRLISVPGWREADEKKALDKSKLKQNRRKEK